MEKRFEIEELHNRISQALLWLGFEDVEFEKRFSANKFENGSSGEEVYETNIAYSNRDSLLPNKIADDLIRVLEKIIDHHLKSSKLKEQKDKLEEQFRKESSSKTDNN